jgi:hypothetical protein
VRAEDIVAALDLPDAASVGQRVPKRLLIESGAPTAADKRRINEGIEEIVWLAALKPTTIGVPEYRDATREYLEISVLRMALHAQAKPTRLVELVHRAIPYPVLLVTVQADAAAISAAHKRWSEGEMGKTVLDGEVFTATADGLSPDLSREFSCTLAVGRQPRASLLTVYQGWIDLLVACHAARITGRLVLPASSAEADARRAALCEYKRLETEACRVRALAEGEAQMPRQVERNLELKRLETEMQHLRGKLSLFVEEEIKG